MPTGSRKRSSRREKSVTVGTKEASKFPTETTSSFEPETAPKEDLAIGPGGGGTGNPFFRSVKKSA